MQFDAVEAGFAGAPGGVGEQVGQLFREVADVRQLRVGDALAGAELQRFPFALVQHFDEFFVGHVDQGGTDFRLRFRSR